MSSPPSSPSSSPSSSPLSSPTNNDSSNNNYDISFNLDLSDNIITSFTLNQTTIEPKIQIVNQQGTTDSGNHVTNTVFTTTDTSNNVQINQNLSQVIYNYTDDEKSNPNAGLINTIREYAAEIQCSDFHGKGSIDDYNALFLAASKIANDTKQMTLDIDVQGFNEFGQAADDLSALFNSFIVKLQNISIVNDTVFLTAIVNALRKIVNLSNTFGRFKETIIATSSIQLPKSAHDTKMVLEGLSSELNCAMGYIGYFVDSSAPKPTHADLSATDKNIIDKAVVAIDNWTTLCEQGVSIALNNSVDVQYINMVNNDLKSKTNALKTATDKLRAKLVQFKF
jgi:hypothetical protein